jgi:hypothetical protein
VNLILDGPDSLTATLSNNSLVCSGEGNPRPKFHWIELNTVNTSIDGHELNLCDSAGNKRWKQRALYNDLKLIFQCVATRDTIVVKLNYSVSMTEMDQHCSASGKPIFSVVRVRPLNISTDLLFCSCHDRGLSREFGLLIFK